MGTLTKQSVSGILEPGRHGDGGGLYLNVAANGSKSWVQRIRIGDKRTDKGLGSVRKVSLTEARKIAAANKVAVQQGRDPWAKDATPTVAPEPTPAAIPTFGDAAHKVYDLMTFRSDKARRNWIQTLERHIIGRPGKTEDHHIGDVPVDKLTRARMIEALSPVWFDHPETGHKVKGRATRVLEWCEEMGYIDDNPLHKSTRIALPSRRHENREHRKALPYADVPAALLKSRMGYGTAVVTLAFEFLVLTAARTSEVRFMKWAEVDLENRIWEIPAERMKTAKSHRVPLSDQAMAVLWAMRRVSVAIPDASDDDIQTHEVKEVTTGYVFTKRNGKTLSENAFIVRCKNTGIDADPHGMRTSFRGYAKSELKARFEAIELCLAHSVGNSVTQAYDREDLLDERRPMMQAWANYVDPLPF